TTLTAFPAFGSAAALSYSPGVPPGTRHDSHEKEDPPEADEPSADAGEDTADHEQDDRAHEGAQDAQHATAAEGCADRPGDEAEERVEDDHDADDCEQRADEQDRHRAPAEGQGGRVSAGGDRRIRQGDGHGDGFLPMPTVVACDSDPSSNKSFRPFRTRGIDGYRVMQLRLHPRSTRRV